MLQSNVKNTSRRSLLVALLTIACVTPELATDVPPVADASVQIDEIPAHEHTERSIELERQGDLAGARAEADAALAAGGGRDANVQAAKLAIVDQRYADAVGLLDALVQTSPEDAAAQYNLALARHHQGDFKRARTGYLAAIRSDPRYADALYNLVVLCREHGFVEEARRHAAEFRRDYAGDPRGLRLAQRLDRTSDPVLSSVAPEPVASGLSSEPAPTSPPG